MLGCLGLFDSSALVDVSLIVYIEFAKGILQAEDFTLLELGVLPTRTVSGAAWKGEGGGLSSTYRWSLRSVTGAEELGGLKKMRRRQKKAPGR
jgi:hypothetical protein